MDGHTSQFIVASRGTGKNENENEMPSVMAKRAHASSESKSEMGRWSGAGERVRSSSDPVSSGSWSCILTRSLCLTRSRSRSRSRSWPLAGSRLPPLSLSLRSLSLSPSLWTALCCRCDVLVGGTGYVTPAGNGAASYSYIPPVRPIPALGVRVRTWPFCDRPELEPGAGMGTGTGVEFECARRWWWWCWWWSSLSGLEEDAVDVATCPSG